jgi:hypothetical protein
MPADSAQHDFLHYLACDLPLGYPSKTPISRLLDPALTISPRRELLHQQSQFLDLAKQFLGSHPWIAYLTALKHEAVVVTIPTYDSHLVDVVDKLFFRDLQQKYKELREASRAAIDETTACDCERLVLLQSEAAKIENARKNVRAAIQAGFTAVEPLPPPPPEPSSGLGSLPYFIAAGVACLVVSAMIPSYVGGMAWGLAGLVVTGILAARVIKKEKARIQAKSAKFKAYMIHESYFALCRKSVGLILTLPFETRKSALVNLAPCLTALEALPPEREALEAKYLRPILGRQFPTLPVIA